MRIYFDTCSIQRPLDTPNHIRILLEAEAILSVLQLCEHGDHTLVSSEILEYESDKTSLEDRRIHARSILEKAGDFVKITDDVEDFARKLIGSGVKLADALHIACAMSSR